MSIKNLVIVESPAKAKTIEKYLGEGFIVKSSMGHIRDLSSGDSAIDVKNGFLPKYEVPDEKKKLVAELKKYAKDAETIWLASDEDREGEAISWHLFEVLGLKAENTKRIVFNEITKTAIGAENSVNWKYCERTIDAVNELKKNGFAVFAIEQTSNSVFLQDVQFSDEAVAFVFGNEIDGVDAEVIALCDGVIEIPQLGTKHSFNIAVSCGMVLWEYARTRV